ncbi:hypothetical protein TeGR_g6649 [Tetraparma gracilis]|uniref:Uncharacterized protein n=1 Tax=Tetraparma gracilis TaxID=2962635 RepID=A0ABQ6M698_9STRA|nr:hypothetical protein TeGR_g6649 [Tetraparma gracilis]
MTAADCREIGKRLMQKLRLSKFGPAAGVGKWINMYPALVEIDEANPWFRSCMIVIAKELVDKGGVSGAVVRLGIGAGVSMFDQGTDFYMIYDYGTSGQTGTAVALACMVTLNMVMQLTLVWINFRKGPKREMLKEAAYVLTAAKPGVNAWRLAHGVEKSTHAATTPELVWTIEKGFELVCESIPGSVLLTHQMLSSLRSSGTFSKAALASVLVSALATGFTSVSTALLAMHGTGAVLTYYVLDMALYFTYKLLRRDLWHWIPLEGAASAVVSTLERLVVKLFADFAGVIQFRAAGEMGGCYFSANMDT